MSASSLASGRVTRSRSHYDCCQLCEHRCGANRLAGERGPCHAGAEARVFRHRVEYGEEAELIPSHLFYLSGCDLRCSFCIAESNAFDPSRGTLLTPEFFAETVAWGRTQGAINVQWVGGEPTIHLPEILRVMSAVEDLPPIVWKSDFHGTSEAFELLDGIVSVYVADLKFGNNECARQIAGIDQYFEIVTRNLRWAAEQLNTDQPERASVRLEQLPTGASSARSDQPERASVRLEQLPTGASAARRMKSPGIRADLIVRHLLLPGHWDCCAVPIFRWMRENLPHSKFSLRDGYLPKWQAARDETLNRILTRAESGRAWDLANEMQLRLVH